MSINCVSRIVHGVRLLIPVFSMSKTTDGEGLVNMFYRVISPLLGIFVELEFEKQENSKNLFQTGTMSPSGHH